MSEYKPREYEHPCDGGCGRILTITTFSAGPELCGECRQQAWAPAIPHPNQPQQQPPPQPHQEQRVTVPALPIELHSAAADELDILRTQIAENRTAKYTAFERLYEWIADALTAAMAAAEQPPQETADKPHQEQRLPQYCANCRHWEPPGEFANTGTCKALGGIKRDDLNRPLNNVCFEPTPPPRAPQQEPLSPLAQALQESICGGSPARDEWWRMIKEQVRRDPVSREDEHIWRAVAELLRHQEQQTMARVVGVLDEVERPTRRCALCGLHREADVLRDARQRLETGGDKDRAEAQRLTKRIVAYAERIRDRTQNPLVLQGENWLGMDLVRLQEAVDAYRDARQRLGGEG